MLLSQDLAVFFGGMYSGNFNLSGSSNCKIYYSIELLHITLMKTTATLSSLSSCIRSKHYSMIEFQALMLTTNAVHLWIKEGGLKTNQSVLDGLSDIDSSRSFNS